jgi:hypothetical protein
MPHKLTHFLALIAILAAPAAWAQPAAVPNLSIDPTTRTVTTSNFAVTWNTGADTEAITALNWMGGSNMTMTYELDTCGNAGPDGGNVQYFGNGWAPPDPQSGGLVLVGGGTVTPPGTVAWSGQIVPSVAAQVTVNSNSTNCPPSSAGIDVQTTYRFFDPDNSGVNWFGVQRVFDFTAAAFAHDLRPYIARLNMDAGYTEVLYPSPGRELVVMNASNCPYGCTGPVSAPGAAPLSPPWDSTQGWFAIHNSKTLQGVVVKRVPSADPQGGAIAAQLWIDDDGPSGGYYTNASSFLLLGPAAGFTGGLVTEAEVLCFYNSAIWTPSLVPPLGCSTPSVILSPWTLTFAGQSVGAASAPESATVTNIGPEAVRIGSVVASGDFTQTNDCPESLAARTSCTITVTFKPWAAGIRSGSVSIVDLLKDSPQALVLAGLGLAE